ncbi:MAG: HAMP domain-containing histidine kinase [Clostridia bacterium]|nr:HAMP domain-containing histidine kinase [Clostridia bacterium]
MHKKIFFRYFNACALIVLLIIFLLGTATTTVYTLQSVQQQDRNMEKAANQVATMLQGMPANYNVFVGTIMEGSIYTIKQTIESDVLILNQWGRVVQSTLDDQISISLPQEAVDKVLAGQVYRRQTVFVSEMGNAYTIGVPIYSDDASAVIGCVFVTAPQVRVNTQMRSILAVYLLCGLSVMAFAFVVLYFITRQITRPLNEMAVAARSYAKGDFSRRITVTPDEELGALAATFNQMADSLDQLEIMRRGFIADVSHELRTPMTTIGGFIDGILDGTIPPELEQKYLLLVSEEVKRLTRMVNNLLDVARIQSGEITYQMNPFDLTETAHRVVLTAEDRIREAKIDLQLHLPEDSIYAVGDRDAIYRVIYNLVDNAVKFTPAEGQITIGMTRREGKLLFSVRNTGMGIPEDEVGKIFERFYKTDKSRGVNRKGVGLGLYMVKSIIDAHHEDLYVTSKEGEFAEFAFTLKEAEEFI